MRFLVQLVRKFLASFVPTAKDRPSRRLLLEQLQPRVLLAGLPANEAWQTIPGKLIEADSTGAYLQLVPSPASENDSSQVRKPVSTIPSPTYFLMIPSDQDAPEGEGPDTDSTDDVPPAVESWDACSA